MISPGLRSSSLESFSLLLPTHTQRMNSIIASAARQAVRSSITTRSFHSSIRTMGVEVQRIEGGDGKTFPKAGDTVHMHYVGTLLDGSKFDSSRDRGKPFVTQIGVGRVIKGWDEGVPQLSVGEKAVLVCSPDYAYGARGFPPVIPSNSTLKFEVELLKIE